ncbi:MAG: glycosyltransferase [Candidatus Omnitrophota bacterium]
MKIGYCTYTDPLDKISWSGIHYFMMKSLAKHCGNTIPIGPLGNKFVLSGRLFNKLTTILLRRKFDYLRSPLIAMEFARVIKSKIKKINCDVLFIPEGSQLLAYLDTDLPVIYLSDVTFDLMVDYYPFFTNLFPVSKKWGEQTEARSIKRADTIVYPSEWAARNAIEHYKCSPEKINIIRFGANLDFVPSREDVMARRKNPGDKLKMLLVGVDWIRKGGEIAFRAMVELNKRGVDAELVICGCMPPAGFTHEKIKVVGFLDKNDPRQAEDLNRLYMESSIFVLPTRSECLGIVYCEACAYGLPIVSTDTGGVSSYVKDGLNGFLLPAEAGFEAYADKIQEIWGDRNKYVGLCENARRRFEDELNWDSWALKVKGVIAGLTIPHGK